MYRTGFTLLELIVVLVILGMTAAIVVPRINSGQQTIFRADLREASATLNYARRIAIITGKEATATLKSNSEQQDRPKHFSAGEWMGRVSQLTCKPVGEEEEELTLEQSKKEAEAAGQSVCQITFYPEGGSSGEKIGFRYLHYRAEININPLTGKLDTELLEHEKE